MQQYSVRDGRASLKQLLAEAQKGETILILDENNQAVKLIPVIVPHKQRNSGSAQGLIELSADFDAPLSDCTS